MNYDRIIELISQNQEIVDFGEFGNGVSAEWIEKAEKRLGLKFPPSYIWWLKHYSGGEVNGEEIFSIYELDFDSVIGGDVVYINKLNRANGSSDHSMVVIQETDFGETYFFYLPEIDDKGETPVFLNTIENKYADNFVDFLIRKITE